MSRTNASANRRVKEISVVAVLACLALAAACGPKAAPPRPSPPNAGLRQAVPFETVAAGFKDPDMIYAPFIFWFWDEPLDAAKMAGMARVMIGQRFDPGYAHARKSMVGTPDLPASDWLGDKW